jgi:hypothetical protein
MALVICFLRPFPLEVATKLLPALISFGMDLGTGVKSWFLEVVLMKFDDPSAPEIFL